MIQARLGLRLLLAISVLVAATACERKHDDKHDAPAGPNAEKHHGCEEEHGHPAGPPIELGTTACGAFTVKAARDNFPIKAGCDSPIDVWVTGGSAKVSTVRFWIGTENAKGSIKARAEIEVPAEPNHWHTHAEIPNPIPAGSKIWVEIEAEGGAKGVCSFPLKM
jgi:hypothetical protein